MSERFSRMDTGIFIAALIMLGFGVVLVYSSSFAVAQDRFGGADFFLERQAIRALLALVAFVVFINIDYHVWGKFSVVFYIAAVILLMIVLALPDTHAINGAKRWISIGPIRFQVSEFARLALIVFLAHRCDVFGAGIRDGKKIFTSIAAVGLIALLVLLEPDFSTAAIIVLLGFLLLFIAGARFSHLLLTTAVCLPIVIIGLLSTPYRRQRLIGYLDLSRHTDTIGYQTHQALIGLGNGGLFGVGLGQGKQKYFYLPEPHTDFVFSILGEEIGFAGLVIVLLVFTFVVYRGFRIAFNAPDKSGQLTAFGLTMALAIYMVVHAGVNVGLLPTTGVPLPFLSYGGMSLIFTMIAVGILLNISSQTRFISSSTKKQRRERLVKYRPRNAHAGRSDVVRQENRV